MKPIMLACLLVHLLLYALSRHFHAPELYLYLGVTINTILILKIVVFIGVRAIGERLMRSEMLPMYGYMAWLWLNPQQEHVYSIPVVLSSIGKTYVMVTQPEKVWLDAVENLIILQSQTELFIVFYHFVKLSAHSTKGPQAMFLEYLFLLLIAKFKYEIHYGTRKAYTLVHFTIDRCAKSMKMRNVYHFVQRIFSKMAGEWHHSKNITY